MGLDNGIVMKYNPEVVCIGWVKKELQVFGMGFIHDLCYWRKCWNVRDIIFSIVHPKADNDTITMLTADQLLEIAAALKKLNKKTWYEGAGSIWSWTEARRGIKKDIKNLKRAAKIKKKYPHTEIYFYDSW